jgi:hypothetical protein
LRERGDFDGALAELRTARNLVDPGSPFRPDFERDLEETERLAAEARRLAAVLRGEDRPRDAADGIDLARAAASTSRFLTASRLYAEALAAEPRLADDRASRHRYHAACAAVRASDGRGRDEPAPADEERAGLRQRALAWLRSELAAWSGLLRDSTPRSRREIVSTLRTWGRDPDLAGVRDDVALALLSEAESRAWRSLWADVSRTLDRVESKAGAARPADPAPPVSPPAGEATDPSKKT